MSMGVLGVLGVVFVTLKLIGQIQWSWWWVLAPFWGWFLLYMLMVLIAVYRSSR